MAVYTLDESQRKAARVAGLAFLFAIATVIVANYAVTFRFIVSGNAAETARNIVAHETLFRLNLACNLIYTVTLLVLLCALYVILKPVGRTLALVAASCRLVLALMWCLTALNTLSALGESGLRAPFRGRSIAEHGDAAPLRELRRLLRRPALWGLASTACSILWFKSRFIPRPLAAFGVIASAWCVFCAFAFLVFPHFDKTVGASWFDVPLVLFETVLGVWLLGQRTTSIRDGPIRRGQRSGEGLRRMTYLGLTL